jgi:hypothetical protein
VLLAFKCLDKDGNGFVEPADIVQCYDASRHPDVIAGRLASLPRRATSPAVVASGKRSANDVLQEFLDTFDVGGEKDGKVCTFPLLLLSTLSSHVSHTRR